MHSKVWSRSLKCQIECQLATLAVSLRAAERLSLTIEVMVLSGFVSLIKSGLGPSSIAVCEVLFWSSCVLVILPVCMFGSHGFRICKASWCFHFSFIVIFDCPSLLRSDCSMCIGRWVPSFCSVSYHRFWVSLIEWNICVMMLGDYGRLSFGRRIYPSLESLFARWVYLSFIYGSVLHFDAKHFDLYVEACCMAR